MVTESSSDQTQKSKKQDVWAMSGLVVFAFGVAIGFAIKNIFMILGCCIALSALLGYLLGRRIRENRISRK